MKASLIHDRWAIVTGASSGLGVDFARELAQRGAKLLLVARREQALEQVAAELRATHKVEVEVLAMDLGAAGAADELFRRTQEAGHQVDVLVNNAGFGYYGAFLEQDPDRVQQMIDLDISTLVRLTHLYARGMKERGFGHVLQVASIAAYQPTPTYAAYAAAKSFVLLFSEALDFELRKSGVHVTTVSPGVTATSFLEVAGQNATAYQRMAMMQSPDVARIGVRAMLTGRTSIVTGLLNSVTAWSVRLVPRRMMAVIAAALMGHRPTA